MGVAHFVSLKVFDNLAAALRSQFPLLVLMVGYTVVSLWILSQPIVGGRDVTALNAPSGTITLVPYQFRELCIDMAAADEFSYAFEAEAPVDFDIHHHDGLTTNVAVGHADTTGEAGSFVAAEHLSYCLLWLNTGLTPVSLTYRVTGP